MHPCLQIDEVLRRITNDMVILSPGDSSQFLKLALTCRTFYEPAMDVLWGKYVTDMRSLILCLPEDSRRLVPFPEAGIEFDQLHLTEPPNILVSIFAPHLLG